MKNILLYFLLFAGITCFSQAPEGFRPMKDTSTFRSTMISQSKLINTQESDFVQEKYLSVMTENIISKGHLTYKKTNLLRWEYTEPLQYLIIINKDKMFIKDKDKISRYDLNSNKLFKSINELMISSVNGDLFNSKEYRMNYYESEKFYLIEMVPVKKNARDYLKNIQLTVNRTTYAVERVKLAEPSGDYTLIKFSNRKINQPVSDEKFMAK